MSHGAFKQSTTTPDVSVHIKYITIQAYIHTYIIVTSKFLHFNVPYTGMAGILH
jgi:hypothetical protein